MKNLRKRVLIDRLHISRHLTIHWDSAFHSGGLRNASKRKTILQSFDAYGDILEIEHTCICIWIWFNIDRCQILDL